MQKRLKTFSYLLFMIIATSCGQLLGDNQTPTVSPVLQGDQLPFRLSLELESFSLPTGLHSFVSATYEGKWLLLAGRTDGLNDFADPNNFSAASQNRTVYVIDPEQGTVHSRSLADPASGLTPQQIDSLSVASAQFYQHKKTLYIAGGYGVDSATGLFSTKDSLTAINVPRLMRWVATPFPGEKASRYIRQTFKSIFQITGGYMSRTKKNDTLLMLGQNNDSYSEQVRRFDIRDSGRKLSAYVHKPIPRTPTPALHRRDLNIVPIIHHVFDLPIPAYLALGGVFTPTGGVWTVPLVIDLDGKSTMEDPEEAETFKQAMNQYTCPTLQVYSKHRKNMYISLFGGISYGFFKNNVFETNPELSFINQVTTISLDRDGKFKQYLMKGEFPSIPSTDVNPGNLFLFGAGAQFIPTTELPCYRNGVLKLDQMGHKSMLVGYIVGGIRSTSPSTSTPADSSASPYIFRVILKGARRPE